MIRRRPAPSALACNKTGQLQTWLLTREAQGLCEQIGFTCAGDPRRVMMIRDQSIYQRDD